MSHSQRPIVLNGRAAVRGTITGVERWALELIPRLKQHRPDHYEVVAPAAEAASGARGHAWEQSVLPVRAGLMRASLVFSPANTAPVCWPRNVLVLHDAAVFREPDAYSSVYRAWHRAVGAHCATRAVAVLTVSEFSRQELVKLAGVKPERITVVRGGVDASFRPTADHEQTAHKLGLTKPYVLTVATEDRRKNLPVLEEAARRLSERGIELVWAGGTRAHLTGPGSVRGIRTLGYVDDADLPGLYRGARAFVLPSRYEGLGLTCLEAMACGTPVVAADRAALPETCGDAALFVDPDDARAVAEAVERAAVDEPVRARLSDAGLMRVRDRTWDRAALETDALLCALASR